MNFLYFISPYPLKVAITAVVALKKRREKYGSIFKYFLDELLRLDGKEAEKKAEELLCSFINYARRNTEFYRSKSLVACDIKSFPIIDKDIVIKNYKSIISQRPFIYLKSSGTTGQPIRVPYSRSCYQKEYAFWWYHRSFGKIKMGDRVATFAGHKVAEINRNRPPFWVYNPVDNQMIFSSYHMSFVNMKYYVAQLNKFKPHLIHGYPSSIYLIAYYILDNNIRLSFRPKMIIAASETTLAWQRKVIEDAFKCKLFIWYGNTEGCGHITECEYGTLHIQSLHSYVRIIKNDGKEAREGEGGRIVATNFNNYCFPLINYDTKDIVVLSRNKVCKCGRGGRIVDRIEGRIEDYIVTPDNRLVGRLDHLFKNAKFVKNAQLEQYNKNQLIIRIEKEKGYDSEIEKSILKEARMRLGDKIEIVFDYAEIDKDKNGKFRFIKQHIKNVIRGGKESDF